VTTSVNPVVVVVLPPPTPPPTPFSKFEVDHNRVCRSIFLRTDDSSPGRSVVVVVVVVVSAVGDVAVPTGLVIVGVVAETRLVVPLLIS